MWYWIIELVDRGIKYFKGDTNNKNIVVNILNDLSKNKQFVDIVSKMIDPKRGIDEQTADRIVGMRQVQTAISAKIGKTDNKKEIEDGLKSVFLKAWNDSSIMNTAISNTKNDIKK